MSSPFLGYPYNAPDVGAADSVAAPVDDAAPAVADAAAVPDVAAPAAAPVVSVAVGDIIFLRSFDAYATPQRERDQLAIVTGVEDQGATVRAFVLGYADDAAAIPAGMVSPWQPPAG